MKNNIVDGWTEINGKSVYVKDGKVLRGSKWNGVSFVPTFPYTWDRRLKAYVIGTPTIEEFSCGKWLLL